jgi:hypothetical protein
MNAIWALFRRHDVGRFHNELRSGHTSAILASVHRAEGQEPFSPLDFISVPCGHKQEQRDQPMTDEQIAMVFCAMAGVSKEELN